MTILVPLRIKPTTGSESMPKYIAKRVFMALLTVLVVACITFFLMHAIPGNPWLSEKTPAPSVIEALNKNTAWTSRFPFSWSSIWATCCGEISARPLKCRKPGGGLYHSGEIPCLR